MNDKLAQIEWKEVHTLTDLPTEMRTYWCRMHSGRVTKLQWRDGNWVTWNSFWNPEVSVFAIVAAYAPYESAPSTRQSPEEIREANRSRAKERRERREQDQREWVAAGCPVPKLLRRKK